MNKILQKKNEVNTTQIFTTKDYEHFKVNTTRNLFTCICI